MTAIGVLALTGSDTRGRAHAVLGFHAREPHRAATA
jgi:hypothetical protein